MTILRGLKDEWIISKWIGGGGNGDVFLARSSNGRQAAVKVLKRALWKSARYTRFIDEIKAQQACSDIPGVLPVLDWNQPASPTVPNPPFIVLSLAVPIITALGECPSMEEVIRACSEIADTLTQLHRRGYSHRDVKPENLFLFEGRYCIGDFGLVDFAGKIAETTINEKLGPIYYIAPEMLNASVEADGCLADVYSLAKTIWVLATGQQYPLPGVLDSRVAAMRIDSYVTHPRIPLLSAILEAATDVDPLRRPQMEILAGELKQWLEPPFKSSSQVELSDLASDVKAINTRYWEHRDQENRERSVKVATADRVRSMFRAALQPLEKALKEAHFLDVAHDPNEASWGFSLRASALLASGEGQAYFRLVGRFNVPEVISHEPIHIECSYSVTIPGRSSIHEAVLWKESLSFVPNGADEQQKVLQMIKAITDNFRPAVAAFFRMCQSY